MSINTLNFLLNILKFFSSFWGQFKIITYLEHKVYRRRGIVEVYFNINKRYNFKTVYLIFPDLLPNDRFNILYSELPEFNFKINETS